MRFTWFVAGLVSVCACPASAEGRNASSVDAVEIIQISATRRAAPVFEVSRAVTVISGEEIDRHTPLTIVDHVRGTPGAFVQQTTPGQGIVVLRGLKGSEVLQLVDGFRMNNAIFRNAPNQYVALADAWNVAQIDVVRGPSSTLYGGDAMGGVIQFITPSPRLNQSASGKVGMQVATGDSRVSTFVDGEIGGERWAARGGLTYQDIGRLDTGEDKDVPFTDFEARAFRGRVAVATAKNGMLSIQAQGLTQPDTHRYDGLVPGYGQTEPSSDDLRFKPQTRHFEQVRWQFEDLGAVADAVDLQWGWQDITDDRVSQDFESPLRETEENSSSLIGLLGQFGKAVNTRHYLTYGFEAYQDDVRSSRTRVDLTTGVETQRPSRFPDDSEMDWFALFAADEWNLSEKLKLNGGVRYSEYEISLPATDVGPGVDLDPDHVSWDIGMLFRTSAEWHVIANYGQAFRPPNVFDLGTFGARGNRFSLPNPNLEPESVETFEVGIKHVGANVSGELIGFQSWYEDKITQVLLPQFIDGRQVVQARNAAKLDLKGIEAALEWRPMETLLLRTTASWVKGDEKLDGDTYPADRIPPLFGRLLARFSPSAPWSFETTLDWATSQDHLSPRDEIDPRINPDGTNGWAAIGIRAFWQLAREVRIGAGVDNLADRHYREHGSGFDAPGRSAFFTVEWGSAT